MTNVKSWLLPALARESFANEILDSRPSLFRQFFENDADTKDLALRLGDVLDIMGRAVDNLAEGPVALARQRKIENEPGSGFYVLPVLDETSTGTEVNKMHVSSALSVAGKSSLQHESRIAPASNGPLLVHKFPLVKAAGTSFLSKLTDSVK